MKFLKFSLMTETEQNTRYNNEKKLLTLLNSAALTKTIQNLAYNIFKMFFQ